MWKKMYISLSDVSLWACCRVLKEALWKTSGPAAHCKRSQIESVVPSWLVYSFKLCLGSCALHSELCCEYTWLIISVCLLGEATITALKRLWAIDPVLLENTVPQLEHKPLWRLKYHRVFSFASIKALQPEDRFLCQLLDWRRKPRLPSLAVQSAAGLPAQRGHRIYYAINTCLGSVLCILKQERRSVIFSWGS